MAYIFPIDCTSPRQRVEYCYRAQELLRRLHNKVGRWYKTGLTQTQYNKFPARIKNRLDYVPQITEAQWKWFLRNMYRKLETAITIELLKNRMLLNDSTQWSIDPSDFDTTV
ncbi:MAG: hypothetical protein GXP14_11325 [Gammaproteobacteria bacterium]|nr:hypothetical protein [Gammaproteobacteria bacterium]